MDTIIETTNLTKYYGKSRGIEDVTIRVEKGDIFGFLGPNGAGKSTMIRTLLDYIRPTGGRATIFGLDSHRDTVAIKRRVGYIPGDFGLYGHMTGWKFLEYFGRVRGGFDRTAAEKYAARFEIRLDRKMKEYSRGMRQKVALIQAFMNDPDLIVMDEPTNGLDPLIQQTFMETLLEEAKGGKTIFMSSHILSEVEKVCNRVAIIKEGRIVAEERMAELKAKSGKVVEVKFRGGLPGAFRASGVPCALQPNGYYRLTATGDVRPMFRLLASYDLEDANVHPMTLEDIFMHYYGGGN